MKEGESIKTYNLDQAATTRVLPEAISEAVKYMDEQYYNPSALYYGADEVHTAVEGARNKFAEILGVKPNEIIFTSGGSESNCLAISGCEWSHDLCTTNIEHKSIELFRKRHVSPSTMKVGKNGIIDHESVKERCKDFPYLFPLFSIIHVNNEIGTIQPICDYAKIIRDKFGEKAMIHSDGTQAIGHVPIDVVRTVIEHVDMYTISGHKFGAPKGIGILVKKEDVELQPLINGSQNFKLRGGTENVPGIMAMLTAMEHAVENCTEESIWRNREVREKLFNGINEISAVVKTVDDTEVPVAPNILSIRFRDPRISGEALIGFLSALRVYCSLGSACNAGQEGTSHVLQAIGLSEEDALRTIRISFPDGLTDEDVDEILRRFKIAIDALKRARN